ncbi:DUF4290 domain-containing protein [Limibacter armeniacum]|uniref:DUF4290 domain-containing protein n=1 Tax=Limibacter armeniacum TaxID=466084 RepID=UPI002FE5A5F8
MTDPNYNTARPELKLKEYGRNVQMLVEYISELEDKDKRTKYANILIQLMKQLNPNVNAGTDSLQRTWDHLYVMSSFDLDVESPYPIPEEDVLWRKPQRIAYKDGEMRFKHYGRNIEMLVGKALDEEDEDVRLKAFANIMRLMKNFYQSWNQENPDEAVIMQDIETMAKGGVDMMVVLDKFPFLVDKRNYNDVIKKYNSRKRKKY